MRERERERERERDVNMSYMSSSFTLNPKSR